MKKFEYLHNFKISHSRKMLKFYFYPYYVKAYKDDRKRAHVCQLRKPIHTDIETLEVLNAQLLKKMTDWRAYWGNCYLFEWVRLIDMDE